MKKDMLPFNKNKSQIHFNEIKGILIEIGYTENHPFGSLTLSVGSSKRLVNIVAKKNILIELEQKNKLKSLVNVRFYVSSKKVDKKWFTVCNMLSIDFLN